MRPDGSSALAPAEPMAASGSGTEEQRGGTGLGSAAAQGSPGAGTGAATEAGAAMGGALWLAPPPRIVYHRTTAETINRVHVLMQADKVVRAGGHLCVLIDKGEGLSELQVS